MSARIVVVGGDESSRERYLGELRSAGYEADSRPAVTEYDSSVSLYFVTGGFDGRAG